MHTNKSKKTQTYIRYNTLCTVSSSDSQRSSPRHREYRCQAPTVLQGSIIEIYAVSLPKSVTSHLIGARQQEQTWTCKVKRMYNALQKAKPLLTIDSISGPHLFGSQMDASCRVAGQACAVTFTRRPTKACMPYLSTKHVLHFQYTTTNQ